jgi:hypothetical protein
LALRYLNLQGVTTNALNNTTFSVNNYTQAETFNISIKNTPYSSFSFTNSTKLTSIVFLGEFVNVKLSGNSALKYIDLTTLEYLTTLDVQNCGLLELDVTKNAKLANLACSNNKLTQLNVSKNPALVKLYCSNNKLPRIGVTANTLLEEFDVANNQLSALNIRNNTALTYLNVSNNANLSMIDVQYNTELEALVASGLYITDIDLTANTKLKGAELFNTNLTVINKLETTGLGIVYETKTPYKGGKMMSVSETNYKWSTASTTTNATNKDDGMANMNTIKSINSDFSKYPAFKWCAEYGTNWYLPAKNELSVIYNKKST